jgi:hypothetical protein
MIPINKNTHDEFQRRIKSTFDLLAHTFSCFQLLFTGDELPLIFTFFDFFTNR